MKPENTSIRLKKIMNDRNLKQVDILNMVRPLCEQYDVKMNKSDISQYVSGKNEPGQDKLAMLGMALHVDEAWLMGYDVPMDRKSDVPQKPDKIFSYYHSLNSAGKEIATEQVRLLTLDKKYTQPESATSTTESPTPDYLELKAAHERTDIEITQEDIEHDDALMNDDSIWQ